MIFAWLNKPYPFVTESKIKLALSMLIGLICFLFLVAFKPFGLDAVNNVTYISGFGLNAFLTLLIHYFIFPKILPQYFDVDSWSIWKQLLFFASIILIISILNYIYNSTFGATISPQYSLTYFILLTGLVGVLPMVSMTYFIEKVESSRNKEVAETIHVESLQKNLSNRVSIKSENLSEESISFNVSEFLYASSSNNYLDLFYVEKEKIHKVILRLSLKSLLSQLSAHQQVRRVHKSYVVNVSNIIAIEGNARSLYVTIRGIENPIPVSRSIAKETLR